MALVNPVEYYECYKKAALLGLQRGIVTQSIVGHSTGRPRGGYLGRLRRHLFHSDEIFDIFIYFGSNTWDTP
jgi:hypothetical protein